MLHFDFQNNLYDNIQATKLSNIFNVDSSNGYLDFNRPGNYFMIGDVPSEFCSKFSISLMFRFKARTIGAPNNIDFVFTTYAANDIRREGIMTRIVDGNIEVNLYGNLYPPLYPSNLMHTITVPIAGYPAVIFDEFCHMVFTFDHETHIIKTFINGVLNSSTYALVAGTSAADLAIGTFYGGYGHVTLHINKWTTVSPRQYATNLFL